MSFSRVALYATEITQTTTPTSATSLTQVDRSIPFVSPPYPSLNALQVVVSHRPSQNSARLMTAPESKLRPWARKREAKPTSLPEFALDSYASAVSFH